VKKGHCQNPAMNLPCLNATLNACKQQPAFLPLPKVPLVVKPSTRIKRTASATASSLCLPLLAYTSIILGITPAFLLSIQIHSVVLLLLHKLGIPRIPEVLLHHIRIRQPLPEL